MGRCSPMSQFSPSSRHPAESQRQDRDEYESLSEAHVRQEQADQHRARQHDRERQEALLTQPVPAPAIGCAQICPLKLAH